MPEPVTQPSRAGGRARVARRMPGGRRLTVRRGPWRWALAAASERRERPAGLGVRCGATLTSRWYDVGGALPHARLALGPRGGRAVMLVHGVIVSSRYLLPTAVELARDFAVIVPDLPGYGLSAAPPQPATLASLADAAVECAAAPGHALAPLLRDFLAA